METNNSIAPKAKFYTKKKKTDEVYKASKLLGVDLRKRNDKDGKKEK